MGGQPSYQFWCFWDFSRSRHLGQQLPDVPRDLATSIFDLGGHGACTLVYQCTKLEVRRLLRSEDMRSVSALVDVVTLTFDLGGHGASR